MLLSNAQNNKKGGVGKIGDCYKKRGVSLTYILTLSSVFCMSGVYACLMFIYTISISIVCFTGRSYSY